MSNGYEQHFRDFAANGFVHGVLHEKVFALVAIDLSQGRVMVALENDGCYVHPGYDKPVFPTDLMGAGFDPFTAPAVTMLLEELLRWLQGRPNGNADVRLIGDDR